MIPTSFDFSSDLQPLPLTQTPQNDLPHFHQPKPAQTMTKTAERKQTIPNRVPIPSQPNPILLSRIRNGGIITDTAAKTKTIKAQKPPAVDSSHPSQCACVCVLLRRQQKSTPKNTEQAHRTRRTLSRNLPLPACVSPCLPCQPSVCVRCHHPPSQPRPCKRNTLHPVKMLQVRIITLAHQALHHLPRHFHVGTSSPRRSAGLPALSQAQHPKPHCSLPNSPGPPRLPCPPLRLRVRVDLTPRSSSALPLCSPRR